MLLMLFSPVRLIIAFARMAAVTGLGRQNKGDAQGDGQQDNKLFHGISF